MNHRNTACLVVVTSLVAVSGCASSVESQPTEDVAHGAGHEERVGKSSEALSTGVPGTGCTLISQMQGNAQAFGEVVCDNTHYESVTICPEQLVTGGWQTIGCWSYSATEHYTWIAYTFNPVPGRWYRVLTGVNVDNAHWATLYSDGAKY